MDENESQDSHVNFPEDETLASEAGLEEQQPTRTQPPDLGAPEILEEPLSAEAAYAAIAGKVRGDSEGVCKPIHIEDLGPLFPKWTPEQVMNHLAELVKLEEYADVLVLTSASGATYLYSTKFMSPEDASEKVLADETMSTIATKVREDTKNEIRLTPVASLPELAPDVPADKLSTYIASMAESDQYKDIQQITGPTGLAYLFSEKDMTRNYATLLARAEANDPFTAIAETVREESRIYPRPTKLALFYEPLFKISEDQMPVILESLLKREEFKDIHKIDAPTGAIYLYSDKYMQPAAAEYYVQWEEVTRWTSL